MPAVKLSLEAHVLKIVLIFFAFYFGRATTASRGIEGKFDAVFSVAFGYTREDLSLFIKSWWKHARPSKLFLFTKHETVNTTYFRERYHDAIDSDALVILPKSAVPMKFGEVSMDRYFAFSELLQSKIDSLRYVMIADGRDVVFQGNPFVNDFFRGNADDPVIFASESAYLGFHKMNDIWIKQGFDEEVHRGMLRRPAICSGTTMGPSRSMLQYLDLMTSNLKPYHINIKGTDQGVHNYVVYHILEKNLTKPFTYILPENGVIFLTLHYLVMNLKHFEPLEVSEQTGQVIKKGMPFAAPVLHQYERSKKLEAHFLRMYNLTNRDRTPHGVQV